MSTAKRVLLLSGGADSCLAWWATGKPRWLFASGIDQSGGGEAEAIARLCEQFPDFRAKGELLADDLWSLFRRPDEGHWPRTLVLALAARARGYDVVMAAHHLDDVGTVKRARQLERLHTDAVLMGPEFRFILPVAYLTRVQLIQAAIEAGCPLVFMFATHSCVVEPITHCGYCDNCRSRHTAFTAAGIQDQTRYLTNPVTSER